MLTHGLSTSGFHDYSISAGSTRTSFVQSAFAPRSDRSDPIVEWALRFDRDIRRADDRIRDWSRDAASVTDEGLEAPSLETITRAIEIINQLKILVMDRIAPSKATLLNFKGVSLGSGGEVSLELGNGQFALTYRIESDGTVTELLFRNSTLIRRAQLPR